MKIYKNYIVPQYTIMAAGLATLLFLAMLTFLTLTYDVSQAPFKVTMIIKSSEDKILQLFYNDQNHEYLFNEKKSIRIPINGSSNFQTINFELPTNSIKNVRIDLGMEPDEVVIKSIIFRSRVRRHIMSAKNIKDIFIYKNHIEKIEIKNNLLHIESNGNDPYLYTDDISSISDYLSKDKIVSKSMIKYQ